MATDRTVSNRERRASRRRPIRSGIQVTLRAGSLGLGPNLAAGVIDVSEDGLCVRLTAPLAKSTEAEVSFDRVGYGRPLKMKADVCWCVGDAETGYRAGLRLRKRLPYVDYLDLTRT